MTKRKRLCPRPRKPQTHKTQPESAAVVIIPRHPGKYKGEFDMKRVEKAINLKHTPEEQRYLPRVSELEYLYDQIGNLPFSLMCAAFDFGFEQGKRYEKARRAKE